LNAFGTFVLTDRRRDSTEEPIARRGWTGTDPETVWQMPTVFIGSAEQIRADLRERQERYGLSYVVVGEDGLPAVAEVVSGLLPAGRLNARCCMDGELSLRPSQSCWTMPGMAAAGCW
jgi:hypothetical protein